MKKILFYEPSSGYGGSSSNLYHIIHQLNPEKYQSYVLVHQNGPQFERMRQAGMNVLKIDFPHTEKMNNSGSFKLYLYFIIYLLPLVFKFKKIIKEKKINIVHINTNIILGLPMIIAAKWTNKILFCHIRETRSLIKREKIFSKWVDQYFVLNKKANELFLRDSPKQKAYILYDGIDIEEFYDIDSKKIRLEFELGDRCVITTAGRIMESKGQREFVLAAEKVLQSYPEVRFLVVGSANIKDKGFEIELHRYVESKQLNKKIIFTGWRTDMRDILAATDIFILPTTTFPEGLPNSIIEAMALSKPVIATDISGVDELIENNVNGYIVPPGDIDIMAQKMEFLISDGEIAISMGKKGRNRAETFFNVNKVVEQLEIFYEDK